MSSPSRSHVAGTAALTKFGSPLAHKQPPSSSHSSATNANSPPTGPLISPTILDIPSQRLYAVSLLILVQSYKLFLLLPALSHGTPQLQDGNRLLSAALASATSPLLLLPQASLVDFACLVSLRKLRIPRLTLSLASAIVIFVGFLVINFTIVTKAGWVGGAFRIAFQLLGVLLPGAAGRVSKQLGISENWVQVAELVSPQRRILGQVSCFPHLTLDELDADQRLRCDTMMNSTRSTCFLEAQRNSLRVPVCVPRPPL